MTSPTNWFCIKCQKHPEEIVERYIPCEKTRIWDGEKYRDEAKTIFCVVKCGECGSVLETKK